MCCSSTRIGYLLQMLRNGGMYAELWRLLGGLGGGVMMAWVLLTSWSEIH